MNRISFILDNFKVTSLAILILLSIFTGIMPATAQPSETTVNAPDNYNTIMEALNATRSSLVSVDVDSDGDGMLDVWEIANFSDITTSDGTGDQDGDGFDDYGEFAAGTDPNNPASYLRIDLISPMSPNTYELTWPGVTGKSYQVLYKTNAFQPAWQTNMSGVGGVSPFTISTNLVNGERAYFILKLE